MKLHTIVVLLVILSTLFVVSCTSPTAINQANNVDDTADFDESELTQFVESDFIVEDEYVEIGELI